MPRIITCPVCHQEKNHFARGMCTACYNRDRRKKRLPRMIICVSCGQRGKHNAHGLCTACYMKEYMKDPEHKKRHAEIERERRRKNPEHIRTLDRKRSQTEKRKKWRRQYHLKYYERNRKHLLEYQRQYRKNTARQTIYKMRRRHRVRNLPATLTPDEWQKILKQHRYACFYCGATDYELEMEHKIPASRGGGLTAENIVPACSTCNRRKDVKTVQEYYNYLVSVGETPLFTP